MFSVLGGYMRTMTFRTRSLSFVLRNETKQICLN